MDHRQRSYMMCSLCLKCVKVKLDCTALAKHLVKTGDSAAIRLPPYRLPQAYPESVREEIKKCWKMG